MESWIKILNLKYSCLHKLWISKKDYDHFANIDTNEENDEENEQNQTELEETPNGVDGWTDQNQLEDAKAGHELNWDEVGGQGIKTRVGREVRPPKRYGQEEE